MNPVDKYLSEQAEKQSKASKQILWDTARGESVKERIDSILVEVSEAFLAGAQAAKEIYLLQGKIEGLYEGLKTQGTHGPYTKFLDKQLQEAKAQLAKLLSEKEQG